jgi:hypothetical protein
VARRLPPVTVTGDTAWGDLVLEAGALFTARVTDPAGAAVSGAVLRFAVSPAGAEVYAPYGETDASGTAVVALAPGRYDATVIPPAGAALSSAELAGIEASADATLEFVLQALENPGPRLVSFQSLAPNPFGRAIEIGVRVRAPSQVSLGLYDATGRRVRTLEHGDRPASTFTCAWDGSREDGTPVPSGVYFVILRASGTIDTRKILLVR